MERLNDEIERLKMRKVELTHRLNMTDYMDEKEQYREEIDTIQKQINILERLNK